MTLANAALLAALPPAPARFHPLRASDQAKTRRDHVITQMQAQNRISATDAAAAVVGVCGM
ncbi:transglycosylase domain-containing protein [Paracoccus sp. (in: a-proteobacteria)]|uniref:transglycosylase domain-containing protein n=1 Tax=Paracoccus sp. TaxID=267 RepID=UPI0034CEEA31